MPVYEYKCTNEKCGYKDDELDLKSREPRKDRVCPKCGAIMKNIISKDGSFKFNVRMS